MAQRQYSSERCLRPHGSYQTNAPAPAPTSWCTPGFAWKGICPRSPCCRTWPKHKCCAPAMHPARQDVPRIPFHGKAKPHLLNFQHWRTCHTTEIISRVMHTCIDPLPIMLSSKDFPPIRKPSLASNLKAPPFPRLVQVPHMFSLICNAQVGRQGCTLRSYRSGQSVNGRSSPGSSENKETACHCTTHI